MRLSKLLIENDFDIKKLTSFKIGGKIAKVYFPENIDEFVRVMSEYPNAFVAGNLSNTLVSSDGYDGVVVITSKTDNISVNGTHVTAGAGVRGQKLSQYVCDEGLSGLEFMIGFPGSVGGEVFMNASANGQCISDCIKSVKIFCADEGLTVLNRDEMQFGYRSSVCHHKKYTVLEAEFELERKSKETIKEKMDENLAFRSAFQPLLNYPNCGSIFKNPDNNSAGKLLEMCGFKGKRCGGVKVWENHANFIINDNNGTSKDVLNLMCEMKAGVSEKFGIELEPEIRYLGGKDEVELCGKLKI